MLKNKKFLIFVLSLLPFGSISATDLRVEFRDSLGGDDTTAIYRYDTVYTPSMKIHGWNFLNFWTEIRDSDTNFVEDTIIVSMQHSPDGINWTIVALDTIEHGDNDTMAVSSVIVNATTGIIGNWMRGMFVHRDSIEAAADLQGNVYVKEFILWVAPKN